MPATLIGAHMPTGKGLGDAIRRGHEIGCTAVQVFTSSPQQWKSKPVTPEAVSDFNAAKVETGIHHVVSHDSYLINLCAAGEELREKSVAGLTGEMERCGAYGIPLVVSHIGAWTTLEVSEAEKLAAENIQRVLAQTPDSVTLLMETTAGQGTVLNSNFEQMARIFELAGSPARLAVCIDTCHLFSAGYDLQTLETYEKVFADFDRLLGCEKIRCIHANDSKFPFASRKDRHEHLGQGSLGPEPFQFLVQDPRFEAVPIVVETPEAETEHATNVGRLWAWAKV